MRDGFDYLELISLQVLCKIHKRAVEAIPKELFELIASLTEQMHLAAASLAFEVAARLRDEISELKKELSGMEGAR